MKKFLTVVALLAAVPFMTSSAEATEITSRQDAKSVATVLVYDQICKSPLSDMVRDYQDRTVKRAEYSAKELEDALMVTTAAATKNPDIWCPLTTKGFDILTELLRRY